MNAADRTRLLSLGVLDHPELSLNESLRSRAESDCSDLKIPSSRRDPPLPRFSDAGVADLKSIRASRSIPENLGFNGSPPRSLPRDSSPSARYSTIADGNAARSSSPYRGGSPDRNAARERICSIGFNRMRGIGGGEDIVIFEARRSRDQERDTEARRVYEDRLRAYESRIDDLQRAEKQSQ
ncbi:hypothetical protein BDK51DRAFT_27336, partial [Blyttiomyces helicus]